MFGALARVPGAVGFRKETAMQVKTTRWSCCLAALLAVVMLTGCSSENWDWDWWRSGKNKGTTKPMSKKPRSRHSETRTARAPREKARSSSDPRASEVDAMVHTYVNEMSVEGDTPYRPNDFNAKIQRQQDPKRKSRIRTVAERTRAQPTPAGTPVRDTAARRADHRDAEARSQHDDPAVHAAAMGRQPSADGASSVQPRDGRETAPAAPGPNPSETSASPVTTEATPSPRPPAESAGTFSMPSTGTAKAMSTPEAIEAPETQAGGAQAQPPVLKGIEVSAGPEPSSETRSSSEARTAQANTAKTPVTSPDTLKQRLEELKARVKAEPNNIEAQYDWRLALIANGQADAALTAVDGTDSEIQAMMQAHIRALIAARSGTSRDPAVSANRQLEEIESLREILSAQADLRVPRVELCTAIEGFGRYTPIEIAEYPAGQKNRVLLYIEVDNFRSEKTPSGMYRTLLSVRQSLLNKAGEEIWSTHDANIEDLARQQRRDFYLTVGPLTIPKSLAPGEYFLKVEVEDVLGDKFNSNTARFKMVP